jgi:hypothetical protein
MILDWTWHLVISSIQFILKYLTLFPSSIDSLSSSSTPSFPSFRLRSITADSADSVICGELRLLDFASFFPPSIPLHPSPFYVGLLGCSGSTFEYGGMHTAEGSPLRLVASKNHSRPGYKYSRFLSTAAVCSPGYGWALETPVVDRKQSNFGGCPGFSTLYDGLTFFLAPHYPTSCGKWMKGG